MKLTHRTKDDPFDAASVPHDEPEDDASDTRTPNSNRAQQPDIESPGVHPARLAAWAITLVIAVATLLLWLVASPLVAVIFLAVLIGSLLVAGVAWILWRRQGGRRGNDKGRSRRWNELGGRPGSKSRTGDRRGSKKGSPGDSTKGGRLRGLLNRNKKGGKNNKNKSNSGGNGKNNKNNKNNNDGGNGKNTSNGSGGPWWRRLSPWRNKSSNDTAPAKKDKRGNKRKRRGGGSGNGSDSSNQSKSKNGKKDEAGGADNKKGLMRHLRDRRKKNKDAKKKDTRNSNPENANDKNKRKRKTRRGSRGRGGRRSLLDIMNRTNSKGTGKLKIEAVSDGIIIKNDDRKQEKPQAGKSANKKPAGTDKKPATPKGPDPKWRATLDDSIPNPPAPPRKKQRKEPPPPLEYDDGGFPVYTKPPTKEGKEQVAAIKKRVNVSVDNPYVHAQEYSTPQGRAGMMLEAAKDCRNQAAEKQARVEKYEDEIRSLKEKHGTGDRIRLLSEQIDHLQTDISNLLGEAAGREEAANEEMQEAQMG